METFVSIVKPNMKTSVSIGSRLREERDRLGLKQEVFAQLTPSGTRQSQSNYEKDARSPDAKYLEAIASAGADVLYIVTGERKTAVPGAFDPKLLRDVVEAVEAQKMRHLSPPKKAELIALLYEHFLPQKTLDQPTFQRYLRLVA